ncbi:CBO0543 family protein [Gracilibacillus sp. YIM 98692]|uniref:CBO0543 family protein n=1 Tax=Gracilibacillus sp. YIM 98692 TaxID=2663532 RepID=UPI0013CFA41B|nr:CBO0543 family protein [Gracilibacillus sp. YIM 98692]
MNNQHSSWKETLNIRETFREEYLSYWINDNFLSLGWWIILLFNVVLIYAAWKLLDRTRLFEILTIGGLTITFSTFIDTVTVQYGLTAYPISLTPLSPSFFTSTYTTLPIIYMLVYQYFTTWKSYIVANVVVAVVLAFVIENLLHWLNIYEYIQWNSFYSFIIYIALGVMMKGILGMLLKADKH